MKFNLFKMVGGYFSNDLSIDLGTANTLIYTKDVGIVREKLHHYRWLASKLLPSLYGDKQEVVQDTKITIQWQQDPKIVEGQVVSAD